MSNLESIASAEQALIGAIIRDNALLDSLRVSPAHLTTFHAKAAMVAAESLRAAGKPFDEIVLFDSIDTKAVDLAYLTQAGISGMPAYAAEYEAAILAFQRKKQFLELMDEAKRMCAQHGVEHAMGEVLEQINRIDTGNKRSAINISQAVGALIRDIEDNSDKPRGLPTGVAALDLSIGGFRQGIVSVVAARPAMGKSSFGLSIARANAMAGNGVHVFTLEDSTEMYSARYVSREGAVSTDNLMAANLTRKQVDNLATLRTRLKQGLPWLLDEATPDDPAELVRRVRTEAIANKTKVVVVDYLQIVAHGMHDARSEHDAVTRCMHAFQQAAKRDNMAYVVMCQLNRKAEEREDKRPVLSDLRASGSIEEKAKLVIGLYRGAYYHDEPIRGIDYPEKGYPPTEEEFREQLKLCVIKNSSGPTGDVEARWQGEFCAVS